jgi:hypothetical protein
MNAAAGIAAAADPEAAYYQTIEEFFVSRRGDPLFLSNADWLLIRGWRKAGTPLRVVLRGIGDALDGHAHSWGRHRKVGSLAYCAAEVDVARDRWQRALALGKDEDGAPDAALSGLADALESAAPGLEGPARAEAMGLAGEIREWGAGPPPLREMEKRLAKGESALLARLIESAGTERVVEVEAAADAELLPYASRMPAKVLAQIRKDSITRRVLALFGIPRLSLFGL